MDIGQARAILDLAHSAFISMDEEGRIVYWNIRAEEIFGFTRAQAVGRVLADTVIPERLRESHWEGLRRFRETGEGPVLNQRLEMTAIRSDGDEFPVELTISAISEPEGWSFHAFVADISERSRLEQERQMLMDELQLALRGTEQRLAVIVDALGEAVTIRGPDDHLIHANRAALDRMGLSSVEELREADPRILMGGWETLGEDGSEISMEDLPSVRALRGEQPEPLMLRSVHRGTGEEQWVLLKATAIYDSSGTIEAAVTIIEDVTAARRSSLRMEFLARASQVLASSLDYQETLRNVAGLAVPQVADWCAVDLFDEEGVREPVAVAHIDPSKLEMAERLRAFDPDELDPDQGLGLVRRTGEPVLYNDIPDELLVAAAVDDEHLGLLRAVGMRAVLIVPMVGRSSTIGALTLVSAESGRTFDQSDVEFAEQIAERAALAVENARLYGERSAVARTLQRSLLPEALPELPGWEIAALYRPVGQESAVGGDFYDFWDVDGDWLMMIGDVTGKGVGAATVTSLVRHTAWAASEFDRRPAAILARIDAALKRRPAMSVCTALCLRIASGEATLASGGHPLPLHLGQQGVSEVGRHGTLLGAFSSVEWPEAPFEMKPGETLVAFTDGVTDAVGKGDERFGLDRLKEIVGRAQNESPMVIRERLVAGLEEFQVGAQADDTAIVIMRFTGAKVAAEGDEKISSTTGVQR
ncbi:MAG TPA: SpoIIE family protein phosphatase [Solirubrobacteraceae bacterium]|jgi:PAS domain S-box-containing protein|nr:SpoIIE family protein phosphatase [Solirubrobacteraceae bacterium]